VNQTYANIQTGEVIERECAPMDRLEPIIEDGETYQPVTHDPKRWRWYDCTYEIDASKALPVPFTAETLPKPRLIYRENGDHEAMMYLRRGKSTPPVALTPYRLRPLPAGVPAMTIEPSMVPVHKGLPVSQSLPRIPTDPVSCREENFNGKTAFRHKDGRLTTAGGQQILESNRAVKQAAERAGYRYDKNAHRDE
jgi:hypothetical protein